MPRESCALLVNVSGIEQLFICQNLSEQKNHFILDPKDYARAEDSGELLAVVHSHVFIPPFPSEADKVACEASGLPWLICSVPLGTWGELAPTGYKAPLIGRPFAHGILDCYSLIRDYFSEKLNIEIPDFDRRFEWWELGLDLYRENFEKAGFFKIPMAEIREHDVLLMQVHSNVLNHGAIYLGNDLMLHHLNGRLSSREVFGGYYKKHTSICCRHEALK